MNRSEAHARALSAAGRITLTLSLFGCIEEAPEVEPETIEVDAAEPDAEPVADGGLADFFVDALVSTTDGPPPEPVPADGGVDAVADGGAPDGTVSCDLTQTDWAACCEAMNWDPAAGCLAWGPPVPPALV